MTIFRSPLIPESWPAYWSSSPRPLKENRVRLEIRALPSKHDGPTALPLFGGDLQHDFATSAQSSGFGKSGVQKRGYETVSGRDYKPLLQQCSGYVKLSPDRWAYRHETPETSHVRRHTKRAGSPLCSQTNRLKGCAKSTAHSGSAGNLRRE